MNEAAKAYWQKWHESVGFDTDDDDDYIPEMPPLWRHAFACGVAWAATPDGEEKLPMEA
jgi:hypothetical protein